MTNKKQANSSINTAGGAYIGGNINTQGGDFVGRDKNIVINNASTQNIFAPVYHAIEQSTRPAQEKQDLQAEIKEIETAALKSGPVDETWLSRKLRTLKRIAPDIAEVALAALAGPGAALGAIVKKVAEQVKAEKPT